MNSGTQGLTETVTITGAFTHFTTTAGCSPNCTTASFGSSDITVNSVYAVSATSLQAKITVQGTATLGYRNVSVTTGSEAVSLTNAFQVTQGPAAILSVSPNSGKQNQNGVGPITITGSQTHFTQGTPIVNLGNGVLVTNTQVTSDTVLTVLVNIAQTAPLQANNVTVTTGGEVATLLGGFTVLVGAPIVTTVSPATVNQGATVPMTVNGLYTHFNSGITGASFSPNDVTFVSVNSGATATQAVINVSVSNTAALGSHSITVMDPTDVSASGTGVFTVAGGIAAVASLLPAAEPQGWSGPVIINGNFTHFSPSSVVTFSGSGITAGAVQFNGITQLSVPVTVAQGAAPGSYTVTVTTGSEVAVGTGLFTVQPGAATVSISPNVGNPGTTPIVTITGTNTHFDPVLANDTVSIGSTPNITATITNVLGQTITAKLTIAAGAALQAYDVSVSDKGNGGDPNPMTITGGFTIEAAAPVAPTIVVTAPVSSATNVPTNTKFTFELSEPIQNASTPAPPGVATGNVILFDQSIGGYSCDPSAAAMVSGAVTTDGSGRIVTFTPAQDLKVSNAYILCIDGSLNGWTSPWSSPVIQSQGASPQSLAYTYYTFTTGFGPDTSGPSFTYSNISNNDTNVGTNAVVTLGFNEAVNPISVNPSSFYVLQSGNPVAGTIGYNSSFTQYTFTPSPAFSANTQYTVGYTSGITDWTGTPLVNPNPGGFQFTTGAGSDTTGPSILTWTPCCGETTGLNPTFAFTTSKPINPLSITPGTYYVVNAATNWTVPGGQVSFANDNQTVVLTLPVGTLLDSGTSYNWYVSGHDRDGNGFSGQAAFITDPPPTVSADLTPPTVSQTNPPNGATNVALNPQIQVQMNKPIDSTSVAGATVTLNPPPQAVVGSCGSAAGNLVANCGFETGNTNSWTASNFANGWDVVVTTPVNSGNYAMRIGNDNSYGAAVLSQTIADTPGVSYTFSFYLQSQSYGTVKSFQAMWNGSTLLNLGPTLNSAFGWTQYSFTVTGTGSDTIKFQAISDPGYFYLDDVVVTNVAPNGVVGGSSLASDNQTVRFAGVILAANTSYTATLIGLKDVDGNTMAPYQWSFGSGVGSTQLVTQGTISISPASGAPAVAVTSPVVLTLSAPVNPDSVNNGTFFVFDNTAVGGGYALPGTYAISTGGETITFTPSVPFEGGHQICVYASYSSSLYDTAGNVFQTNTECFTTASAVDTTPPVVVSITPPNGATGIGPNNPITVIFSKPMNPNSFGNGTVGLYTGTTLVTKSVSVSHDTTAITFSNSTLSYGTTYTVVITPGVTDLANNQIASQVTASFTTLARPSTSSPEEQTVVGCSLCVTGFRPGAGATSVNPTNPVTFFITAPLNPASVTVGTATTPGTMYVAQNGVLFEGSVALSANNQVITFTPSGGTFTPGAVVSVYLTSGITDTYGNTLTAYSASFTVAAATANTAPVLSAISPSNGSSLVVVNTVIDARFNQPIATSTATTSNFYVLANNSSSGAVSGSVSLLNGNQLLRFTPSSLAASTCYYVYLTSGLANTTGQSFGGSSTSYNSYFCTGIASDSITPSVTAIEPTSGATGIGVNALIRLSFNDAIETATVDASTITLSANGTAIPYTFSYSSTNGNVGFNVNGPNQLVLTPQQPLPANSTTILVSVTDSVTNTAGKSVTPFSGSFQTGPAPNFTAPQVVSTSVSNNDTNVPVNSVFTITFNEPIDTRSLQYNSTIDLRDNQYSTGQPNNSVPALMTYSADGSQVTIAPLAPLAAGRQYYFGVCNVFDLTGNPSGCWAILNYFTTALTPPANLSVLRVTPPNLTPALVVGTNVHPEVQFNHPVSELSALANISLTQGGTTVPASISFSSSDTVVTVSPNVILQPNEPYILTIGGGTTGVTDASAAQQQYTPVAYLHTGDSAVGVPLANGAADTNWTVAGPAVPSANPVVLSPANRYSSWAADDSNSQWIGVHNTVSQPEAPYTFTTTFSLTNPASALLSLYWGIDDDGTLALNGTPIATGNGIYTLQSVNVGGSSGLFVTGTNTLTVTMTSSDQQWDGIRVVGTVSEQSSSTPAVGTYLPSSITSQFQTGASIDLTAPSITAISPSPSNVVTGTNPVLQVSFSEPVDPLRSSGWYLSNQVTGRNIALTPSWSSSLMSVSFSYASYVNSSGAAGQLDPNTNYYFNSGSYYDLVGNGPVSTGQYFTTGSVPISSAPVVNNWTPALGATGVPLNPVIAMQMSSPIDPTSLQASSIGLVPATAGSLQLSSDGYTLSFVPAGSLNAGTPYTLQVLASAFTDINGNAVAAFSSTFTTTTAALTGNGTITLASPSPEATNVPVNSAVIINLNRAVDPLTVTQSSFQVFQTDNSAYPIAGTVAVVSPTQLSFTPIGPLPANSTLWVYAGWSTAMKDVSGNNFTCLCGSNDSFTTATVTNAAPTVLAVTPLNDSTGNGPNTVVTLVFSEALNYNTINSSNFQLYSGYSNLGASIGYSADRNIVTLSYANLPYNSPITVSVGTGVLDLNGNHMASPFTSTFTTIAKPATAAPTVVQLRPANGTSGVSLSAPITIYTSSPVDSATVNATSLAVIENGVNIPGSYAVGTAPATAEGQTIVFTPTQPWSASGLVQVFLTSAVTDVWGNAFTAYSAQFNTQAQPSNPALTGPSLVSITPCSDCYSALNSVVVATFDQAIASGANTGNFYLLTSSNGSGTPIAGSVNQSASNPNQLELIPGTLAANTWYYVYLTTGIQNADGLGFAAGSTTTYAGYFYTGNPADHISPVVNTVAPSNGTNVGDNVIPQFTFNDTVDTNTINPNTVTLTANGSSVPFTLSFGSNYSTSPGTSVTLTPEIPLPDNATTVKLNISVGGSILNVAGSAVPEVDLTFSTGQGPDFTAPYVVSESPNYDGPGVQQNYIQTNSTFTYVFNEPLSANSVLNNPNVSLYDYGSNSLIPAGVSLSPDGTTVTFSPGPLTAGVQYRPCIEDVYDLAGNLDNGECYYYTTVAGTSGAPQVSYTTPINGATMVPTNGLIEVAFNELVNAQSLGQIVLTPTLPAGASVPLTPSLVYGGSVVRLTPASLLAPGTTYQLTIAGVTDLSGSNEVTQQTISFTTGANPQIGNGNTSFTAPYVMVYGGSTLTQIPTYTNPGVTSVDGTQPITLTFSGPIEEASLFGNAVKLYTAIGSTAVPFGITLSNGGSTATITPTGALAAATEYELTVNYNGSVYDQAGYAVANGAYFYFTTK